MPNRAVTPRILTIAAAIALALGTSACSGLMATRTQGYEISENALKQIRPGQSIELVTTVLGSPQSTNTFGEETAFYYVQTKVQETAFGWRSVTDRKVLAIYFDKNNRVRERALYGIEDGRVINVETRRTPSFGEDRTFVESIIRSVGG